MWSKWDWIISILIIAIAVVTGLIIQKKNAGYLLPKTMLENRKQLYGWALSLWGQLHH